MTRNLPESNRILLPAVAVMMVLVVSGCKKEAPAPQNAPAPQAAQQAKPAAAAVQKQMSSPVPKLPAAPVNQFDFSTKKDPFRPYIIIKPSAAANRASRPDALPIHRFDVGQFRLIGIITGARENQAMVTDPNGKGYVLKTGMTIGKNNGRITAITNSGVDVLEQFRDDDGKVRKEHIKITLPRKQ